MHLYPRISTIQTTELGSLFLDKAQAGTSFERKLIGWKRDEQGMRLMKLEGLTKMHGGVQVLVGLEIDIFDSWSRVRRIETITKMSLYKFFNNLVQIGSKAHPSSLAYYSRLPDVYIIWGT
jgi:hypothetical protein